MKTRELVGSDPLKYSHKVENYKIPNTRANALNGIHGSSGMAGALFSGD